VTASGSVIVCGGTGRYLRAAIVDLAVPPAPPEGMRERWEDVYDRDPAAAHRQLRELDASAAAIVHRNDRRRVVRALELAELGSSLVPDEDRLWTATTRLPTLIIGLELPAAELERRIVVRTDAMFAAGVVEEVRTALRQPVSRTAERALGLREIAQLDPDSARQTIVLRTRRYAAYQRKWMRRIPGIVSVDAMRSPDEVANAILEVARTR
jgi:tRNA dimethylallyltransferase